MYFVGLNHTKVEATDRYVTRACLLETSVWLKGAESYTCAAKALQNLTHPSTVFVEDISVTYP